MSDGVRVHLLDDATGWQRDRVRLVIAERIAGAIRVLRSDGTWDDWDVPDGTSPDLATVGWLVPVEALEAIVLAVEQRLGHASHADTEARVLRESLDIERRRVDRLLTKALEP